MSNNAIVRRGDQGQAMAQAYQMPVDPITGLSVDVFPQSYGPKERSIVMAICERYGLDPIAREVELLHGQVFITAKGINRIATQDPAFDGVTIEIIEQDWQRGWFLVKASAWRKGCSHPIEEYADSDGSKMKGGNKFRHTITRAKARAMRAAFAIPFTAREELDDNDAPQRYIPPASTRALPTPTPTTAPTTVDTIVSDPLRSGAMRKLHAVAKERGLNHDDLRDALGVESIADLSTDDLSGAAMLLECISLVQLKAAWLRIGSPELSALKDWCKGDLEAGAA